MEVFNNTLKIVLCFLLLMINLSLTLAQESQSDTILQQINQDVWNNFKTAYLDNNDSLYNSIHTDDILRITNSGFKIGEEYKQRNIDRFSKISQNSRRIDFRFEDRISNDSLAYEIGYYKLEYLQDQEVLKTYFGRFHVLLKKINGKWKIAQDWDSNKINSIRVSAEDFNKLN